MLNLLCRNRVADYDAWRAVFDSHCEAQRESGLILRELWRDVGEPNNVFFLFRVTDEAKARAFLAAPASIAAGEASGVIDGEAHFVAGDPV